MVSYLDSLDISIHNSTGRVYRIGPVRYTRNTADYLVPVRVEAIVVYSGCAWLLRVIGDTCNRSQVQVQVEVEVEVEVEIRGEVEVCLTYVVMSDWRSVISDIVCSLSVSIWTHTMQRTETTLTRRIRRLVYQDIMRQKHVKKSTK